MGAESRFSPDGGPGGVSDGDAFDASRSLSMKRWIAIAEVVFTG